MHTTIGITALKDKQLVIIAKGSGFSYSFDAVNTKCYYMAKILKSYGLNVTILSSIYYQLEPICGNVGKFRGIKYYMPSVFYKSNSIVKLIHYKLMHIWKVVSFLVYLKKKRNTVHYIFDDNSVPIPFLLLLNWIGVIDLIFNIEEWPLAHGHLPNNRKVLSHYFTILALKTCKKIVCVSSYLIAQAIKYNAKASVFRLPAITQFNDLKCEASIHHNGQIEVTKFLYCGNAGFSEIIFAILHAYENVGYLRGSDSIELILILHGNSQHIQRVSEYVSQSEYRIKIKTSLSEPDLFKEYTRASVLLAPLRLTVQDRARFPQKIAEYVALSKPIITTFVGDVCLYFELDKSAICLDDFSVEALIKKMIFVIENKEKMTAIGVEGNVVGRKYFDYKQYIKKFGDFVTS